MIDITETCTICKNLITREQTIIALDFGRFTDDEFGGVGFERTNHPILYAHFECIKIIEPLGEDNV